MIYFDNAATTMIKPKSVVDAVSCAMVSLGNAGRGVNDASLDASRLIYETRKKLSKFFYSNKPSNVVFTCNATESLNTAINGVINSGDHVITTVSEHNSVLRPLFYLRKEKGVRVDYIPVDKLGNIDLNDIEAMIQKDTKAVIIGHASNVTGNVHPIEEIGRITKERGVLLIVDAAQSAGVLDIDFDRMNIDILCFTGHKGLLGPQGTGGMIIREGINIRPLKSGGTGIQTYKETQPDELPEHLEAGTLNGHGIAGLNAALDYINIVGRQAIYLREESLMKMFYENIKDIPGMVIYGDFSLSERAPIVSLNIEWMDSALLGDVLYNEYEISIRSGAHCAPLLHKALGTKEIGAVRFSFSHFNKEEEIETAVNALRRIANEK